jgi:hypothetical protein
LAWRLAGSRRGPTYLNNSAERYVISEMKLEHLTRQIELDEKQKEQFRVLLEDTERNG